MKVLIVSDNHRDEASLEDLIYIYEKEIDLWLHCGDSEFGVDHPVWNTFVTVQGNMDWENKLPKIAVEENEGTRFAVLHGHNHQVRRSLEPMEEVAEANNVSIVFYGHTHVAKVDEQNGVYFINPGSITQPRGANKVGSYAIYEEVGKDRFIRYYDWNHNELQELSQELL